MIKLKTIILNIHLIILDQDENSVSETFILSAGSNFLKNEINCNLNGKYSSAFVNGIFSLMNNQQHEIRTT